MPGPTPIRQDLQTARLRLRPWRTSDAERVRALWAERDPRSLRVLDAEGRPTVEEMRDRIDTQLAESARTGLALLTVERLVQGDYLGYCGLVVGAATPEEPEIAFELFRAAQGNGYATEAARAVVAAAAASGRTRLWATVRVWNGASFRVLERLAFQPSGRVTADAVRGDLVWMTRELSALDAQAGPGQPAVHLEHVAWDDPRAVELRRQMDVEMTARYTDPGVQEPAEVVARRVAALTVDPASIRATVLAVEADGEAVGHAALRVHHGDWEVKRVVVGAGQRGRGVGRALLAELERVARAGGARRLVLQTGDRQPEAVALYERVGYTPIPVYEPYVEAIPRSLCFEKRLA